MSDDRDPLDVHGRAMAAAREEAADDPDEVLLDGLDDDEAIEAVAQAAMLDPWIRTNPRPIEGVETVRMLLEAARG